MIKLAFLQQLHSVKLVVVFTYVGLIQHDISIACN